MENKICIRCKTEKSINDFSLRKDRPSRRPECKICEKEYQKKYREKTKGKYKELIYRYQKENPDQYKKNYLKWRKNNPNYMKNYIKKWRKNNPEKIREYIRKKLSTPSGKLNHSMATDIRKSLKKKGVSKGREKWESLVGYTVKQLKEHLEKNFKPGMRWDNHGEWHIDHIIPISRFNFSSPGHIDFKKCWALKNLQPLWEKDNLKKSNKINKHFQPSLLV
jgi:hypothetical protein